MVFLLPGVPLQDSSDLSWFGEKVLEHENRRPAVWSPGVLGSGLFSLASPCSRSSSFSGQTVDTVSTAHVVFFFIRTDFTSEPFSRFVLHFILLQQWSKPHSFNAPQVLWSNGVVEFRSVISGAQ